MSTTAQVYARNVPLGATVEFGLSGAVTIRHPNFNTVRVRPRLAAWRFVLGPLTTAGQRLELRR